MKFFAYKDTQGIGQEPPEIFNKMLMTCETDSDAISLVMKKFGMRSCIYEYTDFYDDRTFRLVYER